MARAGVTQLSTPGTQPLCEKHLTEPTGPEAPGQWALGESGDRLGLGLMWEASHTVSPCSWPCPQVPRRCTPAGTQTGAPGRSQRGSVARPGNAVGPGSVRSCYPQPPPQEPGWMSPGWTPGQALQLGPGTLALRVVGGHLSLLRWSASLPTSHSALIATCLSPAALGVRRVPQPTFLAAMTGAFRMALTPGQSGSGRGPAGAEGTPGVQATGRSR